MPGNNFVSLIENINFFVIRMISPSYFLSSLIENINFFCNSNDQPFILFRYLTLIFYDFKVRVSVLDSGIWGHTSPRAKDIFSFHFDTWYTGMTYFLTDISKGVKVSVMHKPDRSRNLHSGDFRTFQGIFFRSRRGKRSLKPFKA